MVLTIYMLPVYLRDQDLAPFPELFRLGCQRVTEPDLSPLLYKSKPFKGCLTVLIMLSTGANIRDYAKSPN